MRSTVICTPWYQSQFMSYYLKKAEPEQGCCCFTKEQNEVQGWEGDPKGFMFFIGQSSSEREFCNGTEVIASIFCSTSLEIYSTFIASRRARLWRQAFSKSRQPERDLFLTFLTSGASISRGSGRSYSWDWYCEEGCGWMSHIQHTCLSH